MEAIRISCAGFPTRKPYAEFVERFKILAPDAVAKLYFYLSIPKLLILFFYFWKYIILILFLIFINCRSDDIARSKMLLAKAKLEGYQVGTLSCFDG